MVFTFSVKAHAMCIKVGIIADNPIIKPSWKIAKFLSAFINVLNMCSSSNVMSYFTENII